MAKDVEIPRERAGWQAAAVGCHWTFGPYTISTVRGPVLGSGYLLVCNRAAISGPPTFENQEPWATFEAATLAAGRHAAGKR